MEEYIKREDAIKIIEEKQKELCPLGKYGRNYSSDREKYDAWEEIIDALNALPTLPQPSNESLMLISAELERVKRERDAAIDCIYKIEDDLDRGTDNDWAREHISEWESQKEN